MTTHSARLEYPSSSQTALIVTTTGTLLTQDGLHVCKGCARASVTTQVARIHSAGKREMSDHTGLAQQLSPSHTPYLLPQLWTSIKKAKEVGFIYLRLTCPNLQTTFRVHFETTRKRLLSLHFGVTLVSEN